MEHNILRFENTEVSNLEGALRGMRNPMESWDKGDSRFYLDCDDCIDDLDLECNYSKCQGDRDERTYMGDNDLALAKRLIKAGSDERKFLRQIFVCVDITAPSYFLNELDTYKVATVRNSTSLQHKGMSRDFTIDDFALDSNEQLKLFFVEHLLPKINYFRREYVKTKDYWYFRCMRQLIPMSYKYKITWTGSYENIWNMYQARKNHKLREWHDFCHWCEEELPFFREFFLDSKRGEE